MKKIHLSKETLRELTEREADVVAGGAQTDDRGCNVQIDVKIVTRTPCQTFPVNVCVTGRC